MWALKSGFTLEKNNMLQPKKSKFRKQFRGTMKGNATRGATLAFGEFGLKTMEIGHISARQIEASRKAITHLTQRGGKVWIRIFPDKPTTKKALGTRMGSGKGDIFEYVAPVVPGRIMFEIAGVSSEIAQKAFKLAAAKLPVKTRFITKI